MEGALGGLVGIGTGLATGNPFGVIAGAAGLGMSIFGGSEKVEIAKKQAAIQQQMTQTELQQDAVRRKAMELSARRQQMEVLRHAQRARSMALASATNQGAAQGSGLQGGYGQIRGAAEWNMGGIQQNLDFGRQMFDLNAVLSQQKMRMAALGGDAATAQAWSGMGSTLMGSAGTIKNLAGNFMGGSQSSAPSDLGWTGWQVGQGNQW